MLTLTTDTAEVGTLGAQTNVQIVTETLDITTQATGIGSGKAGATADKAGTKAE